MTRRKKHRHCHHRKHNKINTLGPDTQTCDLQTNITKHKKVKRKKIRDKSKHDGIKDFNFVHTEPDTQTCHLQTNTTKHKEVKTKKKKDKSKHGGAKDFNVESLGWDFDDKEELSLSPINLSEETRISMPTKMGDNSTTLQVPSLESDNENNPNCLKKNKFETCMPTVKHLIITNSGDLKSDINIGVGREGGISTENKTSPSSQHEPVNVTDINDRKQKKTHRKSKKTGKYENTSVYSHKLLSHGNGIENDDQLLAKTQKKKKRCQSRQFIYDDEHQENMEHQHNMEHRDTTGQHDNEKHRDTTEHRDTLEHWDTRGQQDNEKHLNNLNNDGHQDKAHDVESENYKYMVTLYDLWRDVIQQDIQIHNQRLQLEKTKLKTKQLLQDKLNQEEQLAELHLLVGSLNKIIEEKDDDISSLKQDFHYIQGLIEDNHGLVINHESLTEIQQRISDGVTMINSLANMLQSGMFDSK